MVLLLKTPAQAKFWFTLLLCVSAGFAGAEITPTERQQLWLRVEPVLRAQLARPYARPFAATPWQTPSRLVDEVAAYDALANAGWAERVAVRIPAPVVINGAVVQRTDPGWRYTWTTQGLTALAEGGIPWAQIGLVSLDSITCAEGDCTRMNVQFHWRTERLEPWALASFFRTWPGQNALLAGQTNEQRGTAKLFWVTERVGEDVPSAPYWLLSDVQLWSP